MAKRTFKAGVTSQTIDVFVQDSSSTTGAGLSGLVFNTANLKAYYRKGATGSATAITLATQTVGGAWSSGGFVEIDSTNMKGVYRFDIPDTVLASSPWAILYFYGATNMAPLTVEVEITAVDPFDATAFGVSRIDATISSRMATFTLPTNFSSLSIDASGRTDVGKINGVGTGSVTAVAANIGTTQPFNFTGTGASALVKTDTIDWNSAAVATPTTAGVPKIELATWLGTAPLALSSQQVQAVVPATTVVASVTGAVGSVTGNVSGNVSGSVGSVLSAVSITSNVKKNQALSNFEFVMTDSVTHNPATLKTVSVTRSIDGGAFAAGSLSAVTEVSNGIYAVNFAAADLNGNVIVLRATAAGCDDTFERIVTQP
jgi:hypothetical protein